MENEIGNKNQKTYEDIKSFEKICKRDKIISNSEIKTIKVVIARYKEDLSWTKDLKIPFLVYNKGDDEISNSIKLPVKGREAYTYLQHIVWNYDNLDDLTIFVQGDPFGHCDNAVEKINYYASSPNFVNVYSNLTNNNLTEPIPPIGETRLFYEVFFDFKFQYHSTFPAGQQFIVSKDCILLRRKEMYEKCIEYLNFGGTIELNFSANIERLWPLIFNREIPSKINSFELLKQIQKLSLIWNKTNMDLGLEFAKFFNGK